MGNCVSGHSFTPSESVPGQSSSVIPMALELGYERSDIDRMFRYSHSTLHCTALCCSPVMLFCYYSTSLCNQLGLGDVIHIATLPIMIAVRFR